MNNIDKWYEKEEDVLYEEYDEGVITHSDLMCMLHDLRLEYQQVIQERREQRYDEYGYDDYC